MQLRVRSLKMSRRRSIHFSTKHKLMSTACTLAILPLRNKLLYIEHYLCWSVLWRSFAIWPEYLEQIFNIFAMDLANKTLLAHALTLNVNIKTSKTLQEFMGSYGIFLQRWMAAEYWYSVRDRSFYLSKRWALRDSREWLWARTRS